MRKRRVACVLALSGALAAAAAGCGGGSSSSSTTAATTAAASTPAETGAAAGGESTAAGGANKGGTYRVQYESAFGFTDNFDPTGEYLGEAFAMFSSLITRTLLGYDHVAGPAGNKLVPDLATGMPTVSDNGLTYTFKLKSGIKFGPPVSREITSKDVAYAFDRIGTEKLAAQYYFYYVDTIKGMRDFYDGKAKTISGIETPDDKTIVFHLTEPTGDFLYRMAMPATSPIPEEVAKCFTDPGDYGRFLISSGPYMIKGSDQLDDSSCGAMKPISGYVPDKELDFVRNPDYDPSTDTPAARENLPDEFDFTVNTNTDDIYNRVQQGLADDEIASEPPKVLREYSTNSDLKPMLHINVGDRTWYLTMNLTQPPFDDIHVRKAFNFIMDKQGLQRAWGGPIAGPIATHIIPDTLFNNELKGYDPYETPNEAGDLAKAQAEMKQSKYDTNKDGTCDASECNNVLMIADTRGLDNLMIPVIVASAKKIGINLAPRQTSNAYTVIQTVAKNVPLGERPGWGKDYADAGTFFDPLFTGANIIPTGNTNYSLVGLTPEIIKTNKLKGLTGDLNNIPSIDANLKKCHPLSGEDRLKCYEDIDKDLMENIVPWVPYIWSNTLDVTGPAVTKWVFDQFSGSIAYAHVAVDPSKQKQG